MPQLGYALLLFCMVLCTFTAAAAIVGHHRQSRRFVVSAQYGTYGVFAVLSLASMVLIYLFVTDNYAVKYVQHYSDRSMPLFYKITSFWGGQDGSLLFWVWVLSIWGAIAVYQNRNKNAELIPYTIVALMGVAIFFVVLMVFVANPFQTFLAGAPTDGRGLNPLLQNPYMVIHPPTLYLGYIGWTIPFCFAVGALAHGKLDYAWIAAMRRWCLVAWIFLSVGLTLGGLWAYEELGWGGYWAWDPVENAALIPWFTGTAFIHSVQVQERRQIFRVWNMSLIIITFLLTMLGTMMTRSGVVQSVHAFAQSDIGGYFGVFLLLSGGISFGLLLYRARALAPQNGLESILSREFAFLVNNWILLASALFVTFGTLFPSLFKALTEREVNVGASFFNKFMVPIGLSLLFLTGVGPLLSWRKSTGETIRKQFMLPGAIGLLTAAACGLGGMIDPRPILTFGLCAFVVTTVGQEFYRGTRYRMKNSGESFVDAFVTLMSRAGRRYGGYVVHVGIVVMFVGFAGNSFQLESEVTLKKGEETAIGPYRVRLDAMHFADDGQKNMATAVVSVFSADKGEFLGNMHPAKWAYRKAEEQVTTEVDKMMSLRDDLYLVLGGYDSKTEQAALQLKVNPLVNFVWLGCAFLMLGFAIAVWPDKKKSPSHVQMRRLSPVAAGATFSVLSIAATVMAFL